MGKSFSGSVPGDHGAMSLDRDGSFQKGSCWEIFVFCVLDISLWVTSAWVS